jgi:hypothetical protein
MMSGLIDQIFKRMTSPERLVINTMDQNAPELEIALNKA